MVRCAECELLFVNPRPPAEQITEAAKTGLHASEEGVVLNARNKLGRGVIKNEAAKVSRLFASEIQAGTPLSWLDVGAGFGELVLAAGAVLPPGSAVRGVEPMTSKVQAAKANGANVDSAELSSITSAFDVVSLINVFSHIPDFTGGFGQELARLVKPGGVLLIETGNVAELPTRKDYADKLYLPDHLVFGGRKQISDMVAKLGFSVEELVEYQTDGLLFSLKAFAHGALRKELVLHWPGTSAFRSIVYKCRKQ